MNTETKVEDLTASDDIEFKKKFYLILKSSLSGDEAAHKVLAERVSDDAKSKVVDIIVRSSIQEPTYSKFYGLLSERLCATHSSWVEGYKHVLLDNYTNMNTFEPAQLRIIGKLWGHIFAADYLGFELFENFRMNEEDSSPATRIFLKFLFQELVAELGINELQARLNEDYIKPFLKNLFPEEDLDDMRYSINYFTSIGLGVLTKRMRDDVSSIEEQEKKVREVERLKEEESRPEGPSDTWRSRKPLPSQENKYSKTSAKDRRFSRRDGGNSRKSVGKRSRTPPRSRYNSNTKSDRKPRSRTPPRRRNRSRSPRR
ncbi:hypothetical protein B1J92_G00330g [Nakaseomyces glabratus]|nr:hypothetical protein B1J91_G00330g [Nakaseomyces glabratus]OXB48443.1 hypothetical protein B1J92_G00330g [Nakaseomyces glabratus]